MFCSLEKIRQVKLEKSRLQSENVELKSQVESFETRISNFKDAARISRLTISELQERVKKYESNGNVFENEAANENEESTNLPPENLEETEKVNRASSLSKVELPSDKETGPGVAPISMQTNCNDFPPGNSTLESDCAQQ